MSKKLQRLLRLFESAARNHEWKGGSDPDDHEAIERDYDRAKKRLVNYLEQLEAQQVP